MAPWQAPAREYPDAATGLSTVHTPRWFTTSWLADGAGWLVDRLLPEGCALCGGAAAGATFCPPCLTDLPWLARTCARCGLPLVPTCAGPGCGLACPLPPGAPLARVLAPLAYAYPVDRLVARAKFGHSLAAARLLGSLLVAGLDRGRGSGAAPAVPAPPVDAALPDVLPVVVPVPLHWRRLATRGFNQAAEIARVVAANGGLQFRPDLLARIAPTRAQSGLARTDRRRNVGGAFRARPLAGNPVLLVDDVVTTAATGLAAAAALVTAGAGPVELWAVARALPPGTPGGDQPGGNRNV